MGISVWFSTETTGSLRNPETRRTPSYVNVENLEVLCTIVLLLNNWVMADFQYDYELFKHAAACFLNNRSRQKRMEKTKLNKSDFYWLPLQTYQY